MAVSKRLRYEILRRDNHTCRYCGATAPAVPLRVDHVTPVALGGSDKPENLVTSCEPCNSGKSSATVDSTVVANVSEDALRWAAAMAQAAEELREQQAPKLAYREVFRAAWNEWTWKDNGKKRTFDLPQDWKGSLDAFHQAGLPQDVWPDIVEKSMTNKTVKPENLFRYCCGIGWRMVGELQDRARLITGATAGDTAPLDSVVRAAIDMWAEAGGEDADGQTRAALLASAKAAREQDADAHRIVRAGEYAAWFGLDSIADATAAFEHDDAMQQWSSAWRTVTGDYPEDEKYEVVKRQIRALQSADVYVARLEKAAAYAGSRRSTRLHFGLTDEELDLTGGPADLHRVAEIWGAAFHASANRWPTSEEYEALKVHTLQLGPDGDVWRQDAYVAAAAAGAYQDPDITTCLTRHMSVFEIAARPLAQLA
jgi:hypothetical protein